jgi:hypothetical protein
MKDGVENDYVAIWMEDNVLVMVYKKDSVIGIDAAKEIAAFCRNFTKGIPYPVLSYIKFVKAISKEARDFFASKEGCEGLTKGALMVDSGFSKIMGNLFLTVHKPIIPGKIFTDRKEAMEWLKKK